MNFILRFIYHNINTVLICVNTIYYILEKYIMTMKVIMF